MKLSDKLDNGGGIQNDNFNDDNDDNDDDDGIYYRS